MTTSPRTPVRHHGSVAAAASRARRAAAESASRLALLTPEAPGSLEAPIRLSRCRAVSVSPREAERSPDEQPRRPIAHPSAVNIKGRAVGKARHCAFRTAATTGTRQAAGRPQLLPD